MRRNNSFSRTSREIEALLDHLDELGATVQTHLDDAHKDNPLLYRKGYNTLPLPRESFNPPSHTSTVGVSGRTPLEFGG